jgi:hypothetical protein
MENGKWKVKNGKMKLSTTGFSEKKPLELAVKFIGTENENLEIES